MRERFEDIVPAASVNVYPNPFNLNQMMKIDFTANRSIDKASVSIYNVKGQKVIDLEKEVKGRSDTLVWNGRNSNDKPVGTGVYFMKLKIESDKKTNTYIKKCLLMK
jgi:flagellar hook assembly protein FlgD